MGIVGRQPLASFAVLVLALELLIVVARPGRDLMPFALVLVPAIAASVVAGLADAWPGIRTLLGRITRWRVAPRWYAWAIGIPLLATFLTDGAGLAFGQVDLPELIGAVTPAAAAVPLVVLLPAFLEEYGWRGFGVPSAVDGGWSPAASAVVVGAIFAALHLPLYLPGQIYDQLALWPAVLFLFGFSAFATWLLLGSGGSAFLAGLAHAVGNGSVPLTWGLDPEWAWGARGVIFAIIGLAFLVVLATSRGRPAVDRDERREAA